MIEKCLENKTIAAILFALAVCAIGCTPAKNNSPGSNSGKNPGAGMMAINNTGIGSAPDGAIDSGGTLGRGSPLSDVELIFNDEQRVRNDVAKLLSISFSTPMPTTEDAQLLTKIRNQLTIEQTKDCEYEDCDGQEFDDFYEVVSRHYLKTIRINLVKDQPCYDKEHHARAASVQFDHLENREICFSIKELSKYPHESLRKQIYAIFIHEIYHLLGIKDGAIVDRLQDEALKNYDSYLESNSAIISIKRQISNLIMRYDCELTWLSVYLQKKGENISTQNPILRNSLSQANIIANDAFPLFDFIINDLQSQTVQLDYNVASELIRLTDIKYTIKSVHDIFYKLLWSGNQSLAEAEKSFDWTRIDPSQNGNAIKLLSFIKQRAQNNTRSFELLMGSNRAYDTDFPYGFSPEYNYCEKDIIKRKEALKNGDL